MRWRWRCFLFKTSCDYLHTGQTLDEEHLIFLICKMYLLTLSLVKMCGSGKVCRMDGDHCHEGEKLGLFQGYSLLGLLFSLLRPASERVAAIWPCVWQPPPTLSFFPSASSWVCKYLYSAHRPLLLEENPTYFFSPHLSSHLWSLVLHLSNTQSLYQLIQCTVRTCICVLPGSP